jgi:hypothetical protein
MLSELRFTRLGVRKPETVFSLLRVASQSVLVSIARVDLRQVSELDVLRVVVNPVGLSVVVVITRLSVLVEPLGARSLMSMEVSTREMAANGAEPDLREAAEAGVGKDKERNREKDKDKSKERSKSKDRDRNKARMLEFIAMLELIAVLLEHMVLE